MTLYYLDSSAWVKRHFAEPGTNWVNNLFGTDRTLSCCTVGFIEEESRRTSRFPAAPI
jgi:hypothetical protein